jgi:hypothetical protein
MGENKANRRFSDQGKPPLKHAVKRSCAGLPRLLLVLTVSLCIWPSASHADGPSQDLLAEEIQATSDSAEQKPLLWGEVYSELVSVENDDYNPVFDLVLKQGIHAATLNEQPLDVYIKARILADGKKYYWNNRYEVGMGCRYKPFASLGGILFFELLYGGYTGRETSEDPNPYDSGFIDVQAGLAFWQWWGIAPWQAEGWAFFPPFLGWRELYGDSIYFDHQDQNWISTIDYKEGIMMSKVGPVVLDAYLCAAGSIDTNKLEWNNFWKVGPGIRMKPFTNLDLKLSVEYFVGRYFLGGYEEVDEDINDAVITLSFWHGW